MDKSSYFLHFQLIRGFNRFGHYVRIGLHYRHYIANDLSFKRQVRKGVQIEYSNRRVGIYYKWTIKKQKLSEMYWVKCLFWAL